MRRYAERLHVSVHPRALRSNAGLMESAYNPPLSFRAKPDANKLFDKYCKGPKWQAFDSNDKVEEWDFNKVQEEKVHKNLPVTILKGTYCRITLDSFFWDVMQYIASRALQEQMVFKCKCETTFYLSQIVSSRVSKTIMPIKDPMTSKWKCWGFCYKQLNSKNIYKLVCSTTFKQTKCTFALKT